MASDAQISISRIGESERQPERVRRTPEPIHIPAIPLNRVRTQPVAMGREHLGLIHDPELNQFQSVRSGCARRDLGSFGNLPTRDPIPFRENLIDADLMAADLVTFHASPYRSAPHHARYEHMAEIADPIRRDTKGQAS